MKKSLALALACLYLFAMLPVSALAANTSINLGGKLGLMYEGASVRLKPSLKGMSAKDLWWNSSDTQVASVDGGKITANQVGKAVISVSGAGASAKCGVIVLPKSIEIGVGERYNLPYGTLESYAVQNDAVADVSSRGEITGKKAGSTQVRVQYNRQKLYVKVKVSGEEAQQSAAAKLDCAETAEQIVLVESTGGSKAALSIHEKQNGLWQQIYSCTAYLGKNGVGKTREGDQKTPLGTYNLTQPFGIKGNPGSNINYTQVTKYHYWCGTSGSQYYNQLVDARETGRACTSSDEHLIDYKGVYNYCMFIDYNRAGEEGKGSCIFLHCIGSKKSTGGCIAVPEKVMKRIIQWAKPGAKIVIQ